MRRAARLSATAALVCLVTATTYAGVPPTTSTTEESTTSTTDTTTSTTEEPTTSTEEPTTSTSEAPTTSTEEPTTSTTSTTEAPTTTEEPTTSSTSTTEAPTTTAEPTTSSTSTTEAPTTTLDTTTSTTETDTTTTSTATPSTSSTTTTTTIAGATTSTTLQTSERCDDGIDNDGDDLLDCQDLDCVGNPACPTTCERAPTFASIDCRLTALVTSIETTPDIQAERARLVVRLTAARNAVATARTACAAADLKRTRRALVQAARKLQQYRKRLRSRPAKRTIPPQLLTDLVDAGDALRSDAKTLRATAQCPGAATAS